ncbi:hypothetical protein A2T98_22035 [Nodularia spumigena CENA596]|uniref:Uncharacterized protein n=1 Tax=Nodularia spumigena CENA596 TaxID=1819295 RepID=A0A166I005_NODSP|nr:hypothetical protein [Nodularia spumigena]KZL47674.1 hypothetical protein A2T98_22035 [Nodularia spumigena CENA596]
MQIRLFTNKNLLSQTQMMWKSLVVVILSILLIAPTAALALDYNSTLQSYVSKVKVDLDEVVTSIEKLPSLSYENGQIALAEIENKLENIKSDAGKDAAYFQKLSVQAQQEYQKNLDTINQDQVLSKTAQKMESSLSKPLDSDPEKTPGLTVGETAIVYEESKKYCQNQGVNTDKVLQWLGVAPWGIYKPFPSCISDYLTSIRGLSKVIIHNPVYPVSSSQYYTYFLFPTDVGEKKVYEKSIQNSLGSYSELKRAKDTRPETETARVFHYLITIAALEESNKKLSNTITLTSKISKLCDDLERRINLATQKFGNVKEYADAFNSFSCPDVLTEITELNTLLAKLTENLAIAA